MGTQQQTHAGSLVPITREVLRQFYAGYPLTPVPQHTAITDSIQAQIERLSALSPALAQKVQQRYFLETPQRLDDNFWRTRMLSEEIAHNLNGLSKKRPELTKQLSECRQTLLQAEQEVSQTQKNNTEAAANQVKKFLPQDFRASFVEKRRAAKEAINTKAVETLVKRGGTIRERYDLLMEQQWERRQALVQLGNLSGIYRFLIKYLGGVPQVLLDFAKEINAKIGPMEEQRLKYGPDFYAITTLGVRLNILTALWFENAEATRDSNDKIWEVVHPAIDFYCHHLVRVVQFLGGIFVKSPFFVTKDDVERAVAATEVATQRSGSMASASVGDADVALEHLLEPFSPDPNAGSPAHTVLAKLSPACEGMELDTAGGLAPVPEVAAKPCNGVPEAVGVLAAASRGMHTHPAHAPSAYGWPPPQQHPHPLHLQHQQLHHHVSHHTGRHHGHHSEGRASPGPSTAAGSEHFMSCQENASSIDEDGGPCSIAASVDLQAFRPPPEPPLTSLARSSHTSDTPPIPARPHHPTASTPLPQHSQMDEAMGGASLPLATDPQLQQASTSVSLLVHNPSRGGGSSISSNSSRLPAATHPTSPTEEAGGHAAAAAAAEHSHRASPSCALGRAVSQSSITMTSMSSASQPHGQQPHFPQLLLPRLEGGSSTHRDAGAAGLLVGSSSYSSHINRSGHAAVGAGAAGEMSSITGLTMTDGGEDGSSLGSMSQAGAAGVASDTATVGTPKPYESSVGLASVLEEDDRSARQLGSCRTSYLGCTLSEMHAQDGSHSHLPPSRLSTQPRTSLPHRQQHLQQQQQQQQQPAKQAHGNTKHNGCCMIQ